MSVQDTTAWIFGLSPLDVVVVLRERGYVLRRTNAPRGDLSLVVKQVRSGDGAWAELSWHTDGVARTWDSEVVRQLSLRAHHLALGWERWPYLARAGFIAAYDGHVLADRHWDQDSGAPRIDTDVVDDWVEAAAEALFGEPHPALRRQEVACFALAGLPEVAQAPAPPVTWLWVAHCAAEAWRDAVAASPRDLFGWQANLLSPEGETMGHVARSTARSAPDVYRDVARRLDCLGVVAQVSGPRVRWWDPRQGRQGEGTGLGAMVGVMEDFAPYVGCRPADLRWVP